ncbi:MAG: ABC transporter ATP-binding protein [Clostridia bacterium]|nr:MAG: ABC transporter ATP-binding protein [Clostridia bacterium]
MLWRILEILRPYRRTYFQGIALLVAVDLLQLVTPRLLGRIADELQKQHLTRENLLYYALLILGLALTIAAGRYLWRMRLLGVSRRLEYDMRQGLYSHLQKLEPAFYDRHRTGDLMARATNDLDAVRMSTGMGAVMLTDSLVLTASTLALMFVTIDARLTGLALLPFPFMALAALVLGRVIHRRFTLVQEHFGHLTEFAQENLSQIRIVKAFAREEAQIEAFTRVNQDNVQANVSLARVSAVLFPLIQFFAGLSQVITLFYGGNRVVAGTLSLGDFVTFNGFLGLLSWPVMAIGWVINVIQRGTASLERIQAVLTTPPAIMDAPGALHLERLSGEVAFNHVTFSYAPDRRPALEEVSFSLRPGQLVGVVGRTGSGKSTLAALILRLYDPAPGQVFLDGQDVRDLALASIRENVAWVPQEGFLFSTPIRENIAFAGDFGPEDIAAAVRAACLEEDLAGFPDGLDTLVGERGLTLSGGQRQRVTLARALVRNAPLLLLDDCLSAVDTSTEARILANIKTLRSGRTTIFITHRVAAVEDADYVLVLEGGRLLEAGTPAELDRRRGLYYHLRQQQLLEEEKLALGGLKAGPRPARTRPVEE